jgi:hypothetical protein
VIDNFALALTHGLLLLAAWRLIGRADLDDPDVPAPVPAEAKAKRPFGRARPGA